MKDFIITTKSGRVFEFPKHKIETEFCFGYGFNGAYDARSEEYARAKVRYILTPEGFRETNIASATEKIINLEKLSHEERIYYSKLCKCFTDDDCCRDSEEVSKIEFTDFLHQLANQYILDIKKRLDSYIKRYGTSKVHAWTFLRD